MWCILGRKEKREMDDGERGRWFDWTITESTPSSIQPHGAWTDLPVETTSNNACSIRPEDYRQPEWSCARHIGFHKGVSRSIANVKAQPSAAK
jgi:hypothetical protein